MNEESSKDELFDLPVVYFDGFHAVDVGDKFLGEGSCWMALASDCPMVHDDDFVAISCDKIQIM